MKIKVLLMFLLMPLLAFPVQAEEEEESGLMGKDRFIKFDIATNYGGPGHMKYIRAEVAVEVDSQEELRAAVHHMPLLNHTLIMLLGRQSNESIAPGEAKEQLRLTALADLQAAMLAEEGETMIDNLVFERFFVQR